MTNLFTLEGKVALVTGASRGIGKMIAEGFVRHGARVYVNSRRPEDCRAVAHELGEKAHPAAADLSALPGINVLRDLVASQESHLDILVCNAGAVWNESVDMFPESGWDRVVDLNMKSPFFLTQALLPLLSEGAKRNPPARVINVTSIDGLHVPLTETYSYTAAKAGLTMLTRMLSGRLADYGINVTALAPGMFPTKMTRGVLAERDEEFLRAIPARRFGDGDDIAGAAIFLASRAGAYVNGATLPVDGGWLANT